MYRSLFEQLVNWKNSKDRKPLLLQGARQVGKTWLLQELGEEFAHLHYLNLEDTTLQSVFEGSVTDVKNIIFRIEALNNMAINQSEDLIVFDEIQACPKAIHALKYFQENYPELAIACTGSRIGISGSEYPFPVGKVSFLNLYPMNFQEFVIASHSQLADVLQSIPDALSIDPFMHERLWEAYLVYSLIGGMPEAVAGYLDNREDRFAALSKARDIHQALIVGYGNDFSKYSGKLLSQRITSVFNSAPSQLQAVHDGSTRRFRFKGVATGASRFKHLQDPIDWLVESGLVIQIPMTNQPTLPLAGSANAFKLFIFDTGILASQLNLDFHRVLDQTQSAYKGFIAENYVAQQLQLAFHKAVFSYARAMSEIEFLLPYRGNVLPLEVKSGMRTKAKSLAEYKKKYAPPLAIKLSRNNMRLESGHLNAPIYLAGQLPQIIDAVLG